jgi:uncharacterized integral membrane protein
MARILRWLVAAVFLLLLIVFMLSNRDRVALTFWPTDYAWDVPVSLAILAAMAIAFIVGGLMVWAVSLTQRRRARRAEHAVRLLEAQVQELKSRLTSPLISPPAA